ncbi:MAG: hypothetical protein GY747_02600 [Planctomycetes bacterium]|nr:hypothetical protein [Planctomycetota bacterium]
MRLLLSLSLFLWWANPVSADFAWFAAQTDSPQSVAAPSNARVAILAPIEAQYSWRDDAFLSAIPAATRIGTGDPIVLAVDSKQPFRPEVLDFLHRYEPTRLLWLGPTSPKLSESHREILKSEGDEQSAPFPKLEALPIANGLEAAVRMAQLGWPQGHPRAVLYDQTNRADALVAAALAAHIGAPLLPWKQGPDEVSLPLAFGVLKTQEVLFIGGGKAPKLAAHSMALAGAVDPITIESIDVEQIKTAQDVARWLTRNGHAVDYLAAVNPNDTAAGRDRNLALAAPLLASAHSGIVVPLDFETQWKRSFAAPKELKKKPSGANDSNNGWREGVIQLDGSKDTPFVTGRNPADGRWWMQLDRNRDGRYSGKKEKAIFTGDDFEVAKLNWTADLDANEKNRGGAIWMTSPTAAEIHEELSVFHKAIKNSAEYLCLVGWPDALPMAVIAHGQGIDTDLVSDTPFAQTDDDPFLDLSHARFLAEDLESATLLACRGFARDDFPQRDWEKKFATAEWEEHSQITLQEAGFDFAGHHEGKAAFDEKSPLAESGLILHASHAMWTQMGKTYLWDSNTLFAPAMVMSAGCSTASLDQDAEHRSVATRLLKNGAVAFVGNSRRGIAQQELFQSEFMNALFAGNSLGAAQRIAQNYVILAMMEKGQMESGPYFYQMHHQVVLGDPALQLGLSFSEADPPARAEIKADKVRVVAPQQWHKMDYLPLEEWGCVFPKLYAWRGAGVGVESSWHNGDKRNEEQILFHMTIDTRKKYNALKAMGDIPESLGWTGTCGVDLHADGSRSLYMRVRLIDADKTTGEVRAQVDEIDFKLIKG